jgi:hypothetical protein
MQQKNLKIIPLESQVKVSITKRFSEQVKYLVSKVPQKEWSGILFYTVDGDIDKPKNMLIVLQYIFLMDIGTGAATDYKLDKSIVEFRMNNPDSLSWKMGHIHSHNLMSVFFSGTDLDELVENAEHHNFYLSVIVNTFLEMKGKIAFTIEPMSTIKARKGNGEYYNLKIKNQILSVCTYDCKFVADIQHEVGSQFSDRYEKINKKTKVVAVQTSHNNVIGFGKNSSVSDEFVFPKNQNKKITSKDSDKLNIDDFICYNLEAESIMEIDAMVHTADQAFSILQNHDNREEAIQLMTLAVNNLAEDILNYYVPGEPIDPIEVINEYLKALKSIKYPIVKIMEKLINDFVKANFKTKKYVQ